MVNVAVIGCGSLGSRHLQALRRMRRPVQLYAVDADAHALSVAQERFQSAPGEVPDSAVRYLTALSGLPSELDLIVVATTSRGRRELIETLLSTRKVRYMVLEKVLFQKEEDYEAIGRLLAARSVTAWVNCPRRVWEVYRQLRGLLKGPVHLTAVGSDWDLGTNGIHMLDLFAFLSGRRDVAIVEELLSREIRESKRAGYCSFQGSLRGGAGENTFALFSYADGNREFEVAVDTPNVSVKIRESGHVAQVSVEEPGQAAVAREYPIPYQSELTHLIAEEILETGLCGLADYEESASLHLPLLKSLLRHYNQIMQKEQHECPIT